MATIYIDDKPYGVKDGHNLLTACLSLGFDIPYFCWHPAMHSVGSCRLCAVKQFKDENDKRGKIVMSCMTPIMEGLRISINDKEAKTFRKTVIEWLMTNHPHDCPVCDEGGECHLQDMTVMTGHVYRRYRFKKRTYRNQDLGPFVTHEMNRCIQCYRCVRFYRDYAGGRDLDVLAWHNHVYFGRHEDGTLESEFAGNLVEVCPTGVFTDKTLAKHYTRKWDLQTAPSVCVHCSVGCNTITGERYGTLRRVHNRYNKDVNGYFLCDRGRYGYEFINSGSRIRHARRRTDGTLKPVNTDKIIKEIAALLRDKNKVIGIGSSRASLETNFALLSLVGEDRFFTAQPEARWAVIKKASEILGGGSVRSASVDDVRTADAALILGEDVNNTAPVLALALRQTALRGPAQAAAKRLRIETWNDAAIRKAVGTDYGPVFIASTDRTRLDDIAKRTCHTGPDEIARLGFAIAHELNGELPKAEGLSDEMMNFAREIAETLKNAGRPVVVTGTSLCNSAILEAAANIAQALGAIGKDCPISIVVPDCNSMGLATMGVAPFDRALEDALAGSVETAIILESDLQRQIGTEKALQFIRALSNIIVIDSIETATTTGASHVLPAAAFAEADGTLVNCEGRSQRYFQVFVPKGQIRESWRWLRDIMIEMGSEQARQWKDFDAIVADMASRMEQFKSVSQAAPWADFRIAGQKIARESHRFSGRTAMYANENVNEPMPPVDKDSPLAFTMEGYQGQPPAALVPRFWWPGWNSVQSVNKFQNEIGGELRGGPAGKRLFEPEPQKTLYFSEVPNPVAQGDGELLVVPAYHVFGSDELSMLSCGIKELSPRPYIALNSEDARELGIKQDAAIIIVLSGKEYQLGVVLSESLGRGLVAVPAGLDGMAWDGVPFKWRFSKGTPG